MPLSKKQMEYLAIAWSCFDHEPKVDYERFRDVAKLASAHSARELLRVTKNKLKAEYGSAIDDAKSASPGEVTLPKPKGAGSTTKKTAPAKKAGTKRSKSPSENAKKSSKKARTDAAKADSSDDIPIVKAEPLVNSEYGSEMFSMAAADEEY